jgi:hypothetical protein
MGWDAAMEICIDESMIKYMGRAITFVQYMPAKPIKHGIKVFANCDAKSAYLLSFEIYTGKDGEKEDGSAVSIVDRLIREATLLQTAPVGFCTPATGTRR